MNVLAQYASILNKCLKKFGLETLDIAFLSKTSRKSIEAVLAQNGSVTLESLEAIAQVFGLHYYELGNPDTKTPKVSELPDATIKRIKFRKKQGPSTPINYQTLDLNEKMVVVLAQYSTTDQFLGQEIAQSLNERFNLELPVSQILDRFNKAFKDQVVKTENQVVHHQERGPKPYYYRLSIPITQERLEQAKKKIGV